MSALIVALDVVLAVALILAAWRMVRGPSFADRFVALDMLTAVAVGFVALTAVGTGRREFLDVGLGIALINFAATAAFAVFLERKRGARMTILAMILMTAGTAFLLVAAIGLIRLRDPLQRMHSATKAGTLGTTLLLAGVMAVPAIGVSTIGILTIVFLLATLPIGAQLLGRASYVSGTRLEGLDDDPLAGQLDRADTPRD